MALITGVIRMCICDAKAALRMIRQSDLSARFTIGGESNNPMTTLQRCMQIVEQFEAVLHRILTARSNAQTSLIYDDLTVMLAIFAESSLISASATDPLRETRQVLTFLGEQCSHLTPVRGGYIGQCLRTMELFSAMMTFQGVASDFYNQMQQMSGSS